MHGTFEIADLPRSLTGDVFTAVMVDMAGCFAIDRLLGMVFSLPKTGKIGKRL